MQNQIIPNGSKVDTEYGVFEVLEYDFVRDQYFCYKHNFDGHSGASHFGDKYINTKYEGHCWLFSEEEVSLIEESKVSVAKQPKFKAGDKVVCTDKYTAARGVLYGKEYTIENPNSHFGHYSGKTHNHVTLVEVESTPSENSLELVKETRDYRKMKPTDLIKISIGDNEFEVPLGDLVHATSLLGVTNGSYGFRLWEALTKALGREGLIEDTETLIEFRDKQKEALDYFFKQYYDKQHQEKEELHNLISAKQKEVEQLLEKLSHM